MSPRERTLRRMKQLGVAAASMAGASSLAACPQNDGAMPIVPAENWPGDASVDPHASPTNDIDASTATSTPKDSGVTLDASDAANASDGSDLDAGKRRRARDRDAGHSYAPRPPPSGYMVVDMLPPPVNLQKQKP